MATKDGHSIPAEAALPSGRPQERCPSPGRSLVPFSLAFIEKASQTCAEACRCFNPDLTELTAHISCPGDPCSEWNREVFTYEKKDRSFFCLHSPRFISIRDNHGGFYVALGKE